MSFFYHLENFKSEYNKKFKHKHVKRKCLCSNGSGKKLFNLDRYNLITSVIMCYECGLVYANKVLSEQDIMNFYSSDSYRFFYNYLDGGKRNFEDNQISDKESLIEPLKLIKDFLPKDKKNFKILDFGSGFAQLSRALNLNDNLICIDFSNKANEYLINLGIESYSGGIEILEKINIKFDLIILSHVVEHFYNFNEELKKILSYLKEDGVTYIEVPNLDAKYNLDQIQNAHNYYFTKNTLLYYMSKLGLNCERHQEKVNQLHLGAIFKKDKNAYYYFSKTDEVIKIIKSHKKFMTFRELLKRFNINLRETLKSCIGLRRTVYIRELMKNW